MSENDKPMELSAEELDEVAGGARRQAFAATSELTDTQDSFLAVTRDGIVSSNSQFVNKFNAFIVENTATGEDK